ncbi:hypothetical protein Tco_0844584 [Tanacetum coccineum]
MILKPGVIFGRSFLRLTKAITDFEARTVTIYPDIDPFLEETKEEGKSNDDWDHLFDFNIDDVPLLGEEGLLPFVCKIGKSIRNKKRATENLNFFYQDIGTSSSAEGHLTQEEASKEAIAIRIIWKDKVELDGKIIKEEEEAVKRIKGEALKEKEHPGAFIFPIRLERQVGVTTLIAKFLILDILIDRDSPIVVGRGFLQSDSDDEEEYQIKRNKIGAPIYGLIYNKENEHEIIKTMGTNDDEAVSSRSKRLRHETMEEVLLPQVHHEFLIWEGCSRDAKSRMGCDGEIDDILRIRLHETRSDEEIFTSVAWIRAFSINKPIYFELCHEFYSTYEFDVDPNE